jgi:hypothetical protein
MHGCPADRLVRSQHATLAENLGSDQIQLHNYPHDDEGAANETGPSEKHAVSHAETYDDPVTETLRRGTSSVGDAPEIAHAFVCGSWASMKVLPDGS